MEEKKETEVKKDVEPNEKKTTAITKKTGTGKTTAKSTTRSTTSKSTATKKSTTTKKTTANKETATTVKRATTKKTGATKETTNTRKKVENPIFEPVENKEEVEKKQVVIEESKVGALEPEEKAVEEKTNVVEKELNKEMKMDFGAENSEKVKDEKSVEAAKPKFEPVKKVETKKKKHKLLKTILILVIIAIVLFLINYARNYYIISKLTEMQAEIAKNTNYSFITEHYSTDDVNDKSILEHYYKDGKNMLIRNQNEKVIVWSDTDTKETIFLIPQSLNAVVRKGNDLGVLGNTLPIRLEEGDLEAKWSFMFLITSEEVNGQDCYKIIWATNGATIWINKENGMTVKSANGKVVVDGKEYDNITEWKNVKFNGLTDADVARPNLTGYTITENN